MENNIEIINDVVDDSTDNKSIDIENKINSSGADLVPMEESVSNVDQDVPQYQEQSIIFQQQQQQHEDVMNNLQHINTEPIRLELLKQFEYYFSSKNLLTDNYLLSQMDDEAYVSVSLIAKFKRIKQLTNDFDLILSTIRQSSQLQLDPLTSSKVRSIGGHSGGLITITAKKTNKPFVSMANNNNGDSLKLKTDQAGIISVVGNQQQRCVLILREVASTATLDQIKELFIDKEPLCPQCDQCESAGNDSWYITFSNEEDVQRALQYLKAEVQSFMDKPIRARIKAHSHAIILPRSLPNSNSQTVGASNNSPSSSSPHPISSVYPVINRVINDSPSSSFLSPSASPGLNEINIVPGSNSNPVILPNYQAQQAQPFIVQTTIMSPSNYKDYLPNQTNQQGALPHYWQLNSNPKLGAYYGAAPSISPQTQTFSTKNQTNSITENDASNKIPSGSPKSVKIDETLDKSEVISANYPAQQQNYQFQAQHPQNLIQMQLNAGNYNGQAVAQAAAVQAYYQSLSQSTSQQNIQQQQPSSSSVYNLQNQNHAQLSLLSSSSSSSLSSTPISLNQNNSYNATLNANTSFNQNVQAIPQGQPLINNNSIPQFVVQPSQFNNHPNFYVASNNVKENTSNNTNTKSSSLNNNNVGANSNSTTVTVNNPSTSNQVTSPQSTVFNSNPYMITNMNNLSINNPGNGVNAAALNAAYQYYHAYNNAINPNYQHPGMNPNQINQSSQFYEVIQPSSASESLSISENKIPGPNTENQQPLIQSNIVYAQSQNIQYSIQSNSNQHFSNNINSNEGGASPRLLVTTINGQNQQQQNSNPQITQHINNTYNNTPPLPPNPVSHFNNTQSRRGNGTSSLTESRYQHHSNYQQLNGRNNYMNRKFSTNSESSPGGSHVSNSTSPGGLLSPGQSYHGQYNQNNQYNHMNNNHYHSYKNNGNYSNNYYTNNINNGERLSNNMQVNPPYLTKMEDSKSNEGPCNEKEHFIGDDLTKQMTKSPPINSDLVSFPPLNLNVQPVNNMNTNAPAATEDSLSASAQLDPAIICISNSANSIPTTPTIINSNIVNGASQKFTGMNNTNKKQGNTLSKILASASNSEQSENLMNNSIPSQNSQQHHTKQYDNTKPTANRNSDNYPQKTHHNSGNKYDQHHHSGSHNHNSTYKSSGSGGYAGRKSIDSLHFNNSPRGNHQAQKFYQQNGRNSSNYVNSRQNNQHNNVPGNSNQVNTSIENNNSGTSSQTGSPSSSNSNRNNNKKNQHSPSLNNSNSLSKNIENITNSDEEQSSLTSGCWGSNNKKLTFAEILQKKSSAAAAAQAISSSQPQQDSTVSVSSNSANISSASSQATTPTSTNPTQSFPLALSNNNLNFTNENDDNFDTKLIENKELVISNSINNSSIPV